MGIGILEKLFGSHARVRLLKLFYLNLEHVFSSREIAKRTHTSIAATRKEIRLLSEVGFVEPASAFIEIAREGNKSTGAKKQKKMRIAGYTINKSFQLFNELRDLVLTVAPLSKHELVSRLRRVGKVKLVVLSGIFLKRSDSRIDLLIVGDGLKKGQLDRTLHMVEAEIGKELSYAILDTADFKYRLGMNDKFVRDVFDYPHEMLIDKIGVVR